MKNDKEKIISDNVINTSESFNSTTKNKIDAEVSNNIKETPIYSDINKTEDYEKDDDEIDNYESENPIDEEYNENESEVEVPSSDYSDYTEETPDDLKLHSNNQFLKNKIKEIRKKKKTNSAEEQLNNRKINTLRKEKIQKDAARTREIEKKKEILN